MILFKNSNPEQSETMLTDSLFEPIRGMQLKVQDNLISKFLTNVKLSPDEVAVKTKDTALTYNQLYLDVLRWKEQLNPHVQDKTIVCLDRTPRLIAILLALQWLKVTYIPVDPSLPIGRLHTIIEDSQAQTFLYDTENLSEYADLSCLVINLTEIELYQLLKPVQLHQREQNNIAYIIYTSGSTGKPKGVAVSRSALDNFLASMSRYFLKEENALLLAITTIAFDISMLELFLPLWQKKTVFLADQAQHNDPLSLTRLLMDYPITLLQATPSMWKLLAPMEWAAQSRLVALCGAEPLASTLAKNLLAKVKELWNMYGPTEATIWCALKQIRSDEPITIGYPIHNTEMRVMDSSNAILPPYVKGELFIGGLCLAEGYVNNDKLTQERFVPCKNALGGRLYRVGDIACSTPEGEFIIFGRTDNQIKLHGYRIELEEIESHIQALPTIRECAVQLYKEQLIAYLCLTNSATFSENDFIVQLAASLPEYMVPQRLIFLDKLPLSSSGKIDRKALPSPSLPTTEGSEEKEETQLSSTQLLLIHIWSEELGVETVGIYDNFFALGGHSLIATRITLRIFHLIGKQITLHDFYRAATIAHLSEIIAQIQPSEHPVNDKEKTILDKSWLPLNDFQLTLWIATFFEPGIKKFNNAARRRLQGPLNKKALDRALQLVFQKQEILSYTINRFYPAQKRQAHCSLVWKDISLINYDDETCESYLAESLEALFYQKLWTSHAPMIFAKLFYLKGDQIELQIGISHFISDEDSLVIFFQDLINAYHFYENYTTLTTKGLSHPFITYVLQENELSTKFAVSDEAFWEKYLHGTDYYYFPQKHLIKNTAKKPSSFSTFLEIPESVLEKIRQFCIQHHLTLNETLFAAICLSLQQCNNSEKKSSKEFVMNTIRSTRDDPNYDSVIGSFLRVHTIKVHLSEDKSLLNLAKQVRQSLLETIEYQRAPTLIKFAAIGYKNKLQTRLISWVSILFSRLSYLINLNPSLLKACLVLSLTRPKNGFIINLNIFSNFFSEKNIPAFFDEDKKPPSPHSYTINIVKNVCEICFHRNPDNNKPFIAITSNLTHDFREYFAKTIIEILTNAEL